MAECGIDPLKLFFGVYDFGASVKDDPSLTADDVSPAEFASLSVADRLELQARAKREQASPNGLKPAPPPPPRKIGTRPDGSRFDLSPLPPPPPPPHLLQFRSALRPVDELSAVEVQQETRAIATEWELLQRQLAALPGEAEGETREVQAERERLWARVAFLQRRAQEIEARREREFYEHVDRCARERALAERGGRPGLVVSWPSGKTS